MVGPLESLPSRSQLHPVPSPRILRPSPPSTAFRVPARGFTVDSPCRQHSIALIHIPPLPIPHVLEYSPGSWMHLVFVHPRLEARKQPFPPSPGFHAHAATCTQAIEPGASGSTLSSADTSRLPLCPGNFPDFPWSGSPWLARGSPLHGDWFGNPTGLLLGAFCPPVCPALISSQPIGFCDVQKSQNLQHQIEHLFK